MSARARPLFAFRVLMSCRHAVTSVVAMSVCVILRISDGWGDAIQS